MSSDDIANLYRQFGGQAEGYQELGRDNVVRQSRERWPLLANVRQQDAARVRPVSQTAAPVDIGSDGRPVATVFDENAAAAAAQAATAAAPRPTLPRASHPHAPTAAVPATPQAAVEPVLSAEPLPPVARPAAPRAPAAAGTELQGLFSRIARTPEPPAPPADRDVSFLRRLLRP